MKNKDLFKTLKRLNDCPDIQDVNLIYNIEKNKRMLEDAIELFERAKSQIKKPTKEIRELEVARLTLCKKYCIKDDNGNAIITKEKDTGRDKFMFEQLQQVEYSIEESETEENHPNAVKKIKEHDDKIDELLESDIKIELIKVDFEKLVNINKEQIAGLFDMINYTSPKTKKGE